MVMRKIGRQPAKLDALDLFRQLDAGGSSGSQLSDPARVEAHFAQVRGPLTQALSTGSTVHGWRTQALFSSLVVALDGCELMFTVDSGVSFLWMVKTSSPRLLACPTQRAQTTS